MKPFLVLSAATLLVFAPALATGILSQEVQPASTAPAVESHVKPTAASQEKAKKLYEIDCAMCHGSNGNGQTDLARDMQLKLRDWTDPKTLADKPDQELFNAIRKGKDKMPPETVGRAKDDEVWNLIYHIRGMSKGHPSAQAKPSN
jgi:thiosulfate dehydrogenase